MADKNFFKTKLKTLFVLLTVIIVAFSIFLVACGKKEDEATNTESTKTLVENDEQTITNGNFEYGVYDKTLTDFPVTSINGWARAADNSATVSRVDSGIVKTDDDAWEELFNTLYENTTYNSYLKDRFSTDIEGKDEDETKEILKGKFNGLNPNKDADDKDNVLMINSYTSVLGEGTAVKFTSNVNSTVKKNTYAKITVKVNADGFKSFYSTDVGASIRIKSTISGVSQDEMRISAIDTDGAWKEYSVYVKGNDFADANVKIILGVGYGNGKDVFHQDYIEGTAFFNDVDFEEIDKDAYDDAVASLTENAIYLSGETADGKNHTNVLAGTDTAFAFTMQSTDYFTEINPATFFDTADYLPTETSGALYDGARFETEAGTLTPTANGAVMTVNNASYTLSLDSSAFTIPAKSYFAFRFSVKNELSKFDKNGVSVLVYDEDGVEADTVIKKIIDNSLELEDDATYVILVKNNFETSKFFTMSVVVGTVDVTSTDPTDYSTGTVTIYDMAYATGKNDRSEYDMSVFAEKKEYNSYLLVSEAVGDSNVVALISGHSEDYTEEADKTYSFSVATSDFGAIESEPANVKNFKGVTRYDSTSFNTDENCGLINTKYLSAYADSAAITAALGSYTDDIQPLMIKTDNSTYGYVSTTRTVSEGAQAVLTVKVKVSEGAKAYIYLVNTAIGENQLDVLTQEFTADNGTEYKNALMTVVENTNGEWATVHFYLEAGNTALNYRVELWNGSRDGEVKTSGYVFFNDYATDNSFEASEVLDTAFTSHFAKRSDQVIYTRALDDNEIEYNESLPVGETKISYKPSTVYLTGVNSDDNVYFTYAIFSTIDPIPVDPNAADEEEPAAKTGCNQNFDPASFWLYFSTIALAAILVLVIILFFIKKAAKNRKRKGEKAKSHYKVTSRNKTAKVDRPAKETKTFDDNADDYDESVSDNEFKDEKEKVETENNSVDAMPEEIPEETDSSDETEQVMEEKEEYEYQEVLEDFSDDFYKADNSDKKDDTPTDGE